MTSLAAAALVALCCGCNTGTREGQGKAAFGPGSTGSPNAPASGGGIGGGAGRFDAGPDLNAARGQHAATLLRDGRVLVTGGFDGQGILGTAEVYDPSTNAWEDVRSLAPTPDDGVMTDATGQFATVRRHHTAVTLLDGRALIAGGHGVERRDASGNPVLEALKSAYVFDPQTNAFRRVGELQENRFLHQGAALANGEAVVSGGVGLPNAAVLSLTTAEVFDPTTDAWTLQQTPNHGGRSSGVMVALGNNNALVYGGGDVIDYVGQNLRALALMNFTAQDPEVYEATNQTFRRGPAPAYREPRMDAGGSIMSTGDAFFAGGRTQHPQTQPPFFLDDTQVYDLQPGTSSTLVVDTTERYDSRSQTFVPGPALQIPRWGCEVVELGTTADMLIVGGLDDQNGLIATCEIYSAYYDTLLTATVDLMTPRQQFAALRLQDGRAMVVGGLDAQGRGIAATEVHSR